MFNERSLGVFLRDVFRLTLESFLDDVRDRSGERETLNALRAPLGAYLVTFDAPNLLCVGFEECEVELTPETIDEEIFQTFLGLDLIEFGEDVAGADF